ncbi:MAG TPA: hypothetical protein VGZ52_12865 [Acidimicrobiales bacterium]|jgi:hypothetical protein|nr:hypothetical protein [Acidimicrobiales bacterium]
MLRRRWMIAPAVAVPILVIALTVLAVTRGHGTKTPARLPIVAGGPSTGTSALADQGVEPGIAPAAAVIYKLGPDVPSLGGSARAYNLSGNSDENAVRRLASALGLDGNVARDDTGALVVRSGDAELTLNPSTSDWGYARDGNAVASSPSSSPGCAPGADCPPPDVATTAPSPPPDLPSQNDAKAAAIVMLQHAGIDTTNATVSVEDAVTQWIVRVDPTVDGIATEGLSTSVSVGSKGVVDYASGVLGSADPADEYPLIGTRAALDRLNSGVSGASVVTVTRADRILQFATSYDGQQSWLLPSYRFATADGSGPSTLAIDDRFLTPPDQVPAGGNSGSGGPGSSAPGGTATIQTAPAPVDRPTFVVPPSAGSVPPASGSDGGR